MKSHPTAPVITACLLSLLIGCEVDAEESTKKPKAADRAVTTEAKYGPDRVHLEPCRMTELGGGYDVLIANVNCKEVRETLPNWGPRNVFSEGVSREDVFLEDGWQCWAELDHGKSTIPNTGVVRNVCMRGDAVIAYKFG